MNIKELIATIETQFNWADRALITFEEWQTLKAELAQQQRLAMWRKVSEELPPDEKVLVFITDSFPDMYSSYFYEVNGEHDVTHWMPCPAPPTSEQEERPANVTQHSNGADPAEICPPCNGTGKRLKGDNLEYVFPCANCNGTGKLRHS